MEAPRTVRITTEINTAVGDCWVGRVVILPAWEAKRVVERCGAGVYIDEPVTRATVQLTDYDRERLGLQQAPAESDVKLGEPMSADDLPTATGTRAKRRSHDRMVRGAEHGDL